MSSRTATYHTTVTWKGEHWGRVKMGNGPEYDFSAPPDAHGHAGVLTPEDAYVAAANTCVMMMFLWAAERFKLKLLSYECRTEGAKLIELDRTEILDSISVARAFTAYQLVSLIDERLESEVQRTGAGMVIVSCLPDMFQDKEMRWSESYQLIRRCVERLQEVSRREGTATLITNHGLMKILQRKSLKNLLYGAADEILRIENAAGCLRMTLPNSQESMLYHAVPHNQTTLEEFVGR